MRYCYSIAILGAYGVAPHHRLAEAWASRVNAPEGRYLQVEGELRGREFERDGVKRRLWECQAYRIAKLDCIERAEENGRGEDAADGPPFQLLTGQVPWPVENSTGHTSIRLPFVG